KLPQSIQPEPSKDDLNIIFKKAMEDLDRQGDVCREMIVVSDSGVTLTQSSILDAVANKVRINALIFGGSDVAELQEAASLTRGLYLSGEGAEFSSFFADRIFPKVNSNFRWILFWLGASWIALMWVMVLPLDRWLFQQVIKLPMHLAGKFALGNALFWSTATPCIIWRLAEGLPLISHC
ncbi:MAG: hypothetical protein VKJ24_15135, partial [Synechococcales bacterium]|nr:hypothetical protein [Synechococcales bacterium]